MLVTDGCSTLAITSVDSNPTGSDPHNEAVLVPADGQPERLPDIPHPLPVQIMTASPTNGGYLIIGVECPPIDVDRNGDPVDGDDTNTCGPSGKAVTFVLSDDGRWRSGAPAPADIRYAMAEAGVGWCGPNTTTRGKQRRTGFLVVRA